jgi:hypothetical protein
MSTQIIQILIAGALFVHGGGHTLGFFMPARSWLFPNLPPRAMRVIANIVWALAAIGFLLSALSFIGVVLPSDLWRQLAVAFAFVSLPGLILFWGMWPRFNTIGALAMNITILVTQLWLDWPPLEMFGY